jgi:hypothetical protein
VEAGKNSSTVIPASRKRRRKGNPVVSDETIMYGYESSGTLTTDNYRPVLSSERAPQDEEQSDCPAKKRNRKIWSWAPKWCPTPRRIGQLTVGHNITQLISAALGSKIYSASDRNGYQKQKNNVSGE